MLCSIIFLTNSFSRWATHLFKFHKTMNYEFGLRFNRKIDLQIELKQSGVFEQDQSLTNGNIITNVLIGIEVDNYSLEYSVFEHW